MTGTGDKAIAILIILMRIVLFGGTQVTEANGKKIADIYWNTSNPIFHFEDTAHMFSVRIRDSVDIICPKYTMGYPEERIEYSIIYMVDRRSYETCTLDGKAARMVGICTRPFMDQVITVVFREFTPNPNMLEFTSGRDYFFISTSNGSKNGLKNEQDGLCRYYNMRLRFMVERRQYGSGTDDAQHHDYGTEDDNEVERRTHSGSDQDPYRGPPPVMILPRPPTPLARPAFGQPAPVDKAGLYQARPWWSARGYSDSASSSKQSYGGSYRTGIRPLGSSAIPYTISRLCIVAVVISLLLHILE